MLDGLVDWVTSVVEALGYGGVSFLVALESLFPPIPSEVVLPLAGFVSSGGEASWWGMVVAATVGSMAGAFALYGIAAAVGPARLRFLVIRYGRWFRVDETDLDRTEEWFDRRADLAVLVGRCIPLVRSLISVPAGFRRMPIGRFAAFTLVGSLAWNVLLIGAGYLLGEQWHRVEAPLERVQTLVLAVMCGALTWFAWRRLLHPWLRRRIAWRRG